MPKYTYSVIIIAMKDNSKLYVYLGNLKQPWVDYCASIGIKPGVAIKKGIEKQLENKQKQVTKETLSQQVESPDNEKKVRRVVWLTPSEIAAIKKQSEVENCSVNRWIVDAIRVGLTNEPQFSTSEIQELGKSNYQLNMTGRNLNQIARRLNEGRHEPLTVEAIVRLTGQIDEHVEKVSASIRASLERWSIK